MYDDRVYLNRLQKQIINERSLLLPVYKINIKYLRFNPFNTRIFDQVLSKKEFLNFSEEELKTSNEVQKFIYEKLKETHSDIENIKLRQSIEKNGLVNPVFAIEDNILLSGNNRLSILKSISEKNNEDQFVEVIYYNHTLSKEEIIKNELILQNELDIKRDYETMSKVLRIYELKNENKLNNDKIQSIVGMPVKENYDIAKLYNEFLFYHGKKERLDLHRYFKVYSSLAELRKINKNNKNYYKIKNIFFDLILYSNIQTHEIRKMIDFILKSKSNEEIPNIIEEIELFINDEISTYKEQLDFYINENGLDKINSFLIKNKKTINDLSEKIIDKVKDLEYELKQKDKNDTLSKKDIKKQLQKIEKELLIFSELAKDSLYKLTNKSEIIEKWTNIKEKIKETDNFVFK